MLGMIEKEGQLTFIFHDVYRARWRPPTSLKEEVHIRMKTQGRLVYCNETNRWQIHDVYEKPISLHCGEYIEIQVGRSYLHCRIEMDRGWLIYFIHTKFYLHPKTSYLVRGI